MTTTHVALVLALGLGCVAGAPTGPESAARAAGPCYGVLVVDTVFVDTHRPTPAAAPRRPRSTRERRGLRWRARRPPSAVDTLVVQAWVQMCPP